MNILLDMRDFHGVLLATVRHLHKAKGGAEAPPIEFPFP